MRHEAAALEINDAGLTLAVAGTLLGESPGFALAEDRELWIGEQARRRARLSPRLVSNTFWHRLGDEALPRAVGHARTYADLAALHLEHVWQAAGAGVDRLILAVPGSLGREQLGLLLGVAEQIELPVAGLIDAALASTGPADEPGGLLHVDAHLHALVATTIERGPRTRRTAAERLEGLGLLALRERLVEVVARQFVRDTRFDPLHHAVTEQALDDGLDAWLEALAADGSVRVEIRSAGGEPRAVSIDRSAIEPLCEETAEAMAARLGPLCPPATEVRLGHRLAALPGLAARLGEALGVRVGVVERGAAALGALASEDEVCARGPRKLTVELAAGAGRDAAADRRPTHLVHDGLAWPIAGERVAVGSDPGPPPAIAVPELDAPVHCVLMAREAGMLLEALAPVAVNGEPVQGVATVHAGDRLVLERPGVAVDLVRVIDGGPA